MSVTSGPGISPLTQPQYYRLPAEDAPPPAAPVAEAAPGEATQRDDVVAAVDANISPDATAEQRRAAYESLQSYVDAIASGGDYEVISDESMRYLAIHAMRQESIPTIYRQEVLDAVDQEISSTASNEQRLQAYDTIQEYVDTVGGIGDAGITAEALPGRTSTLLDEARIPTVAADARAEAERILEVGVRDDWRPGNQEDDYGARFDAYTESVRGESEAYREHLNAALLEGDPGALKSWLTVDALVSAHDSGAIDDATFAAASESIAKAYNDGVIDADSFEGSYDIDPIYDQVEDSERLLQFLNASSGDETARLRATLAEDALTQWDASQYPTDSGFGSTNLEQLSLAIEIASGDPDRPEILTDLLTGLDAQTLDKIYAIGGQLPDAEPDLMATIFATVANDARPQGGELAATLARLPGEHSDWFGQDQVARNEALASMLGAHSDAVLGALTEYADEGARGVGEGETDLKQYEVNGRDLAAVLELTVFNGQISEASRETARDGIVEYAGEQASIVNDSAADPASAGYQEASNRLVVLSAATDVAVDRGFESLQADLQAQKEAIGFVVDLALTAVPLPSRLESAASGRIEELFAGNPLVSEALSGLSGQVIDNTTGQLTDAAKAQLYANLESDPELAALFEQQSASDILRGNILAAITDERDRADIQRDGNSLADDISEID